MEAYNKLIELNKEFAKITQYNTEALKGLKDVIRDVNDTNILHTEAIKGLSNEVNTMATKWWKLIMFLSGALVVLAGVTKVKELVTL